MSFTLDPVMLLISFLPAIMVAAASYALPRRFEKKSKPEHGDLPTMVNTRELQVPTSPGEPSIVNVTETQVSIPSLDESIPSMIPAIVLDVEMKCACGLVLPEKIMFEHAQSTGHAGISAAAPIRVGKIWDLEGAVLESASPACSKCGKPVQGLKRVGKTIYVSHLGCQESNPHRNEMAETLNAQSSDGAHTHHIGETQSEEELQKAEGEKRQRRRANCPICWKPIYGRKGITSIPSARGGRVRFHEKCLD